MLASDSPLLRLLSRWRMHLRRAVVIVTSLTVTTPMLAVPTWAAPAGGADPAAPPVKPVPGRPLPRASDPQIPPETRLPAAAWPAPGAAVVDMPATAALSSAFTRGKVPRGAVAPSRESGRVRAGTLPVFVGRPASLSRRRHRTTVALIAATAVVLAALAVAPAQVAAVPAGVVTIGHVLLPGSGACLGQLSRDSIKLEV